MTWLGFLVCLHTAALTFCCCYHRAPGKEAVDPHVGPDLLAEGPLILKCWKLLFYKVNVSSAKLGMWLSLCLHVKKKTFVEACLGRAKPHLEAWGRVVLSQGHGSGLEHKGCCRRQQFLSHPAGRRGAATGAGSSRPVCSAFPAP